MQEDTFTRREFSRSHGNGGWAQFDFSVDHFVFWFQACAFELSALEDKCTDSTDYGFNEGEPCVLLKMNKVRPGWVSGGWVRVGEPWVRASGWES